MNKTTKIFLALMAASLVLGGCSMTSQTGNTSQKLEQSVVSKTGMITTKSGDVYLLNTTDGIVNITSKKVNLDNYLKKSVTVTGMFSGDTLYVDTIQ